LGSEGFCICRGVQSSVVKCIQGRHKIATLGNEVRMDHSFILLNSSSKSDNVDDLMTIPKLMGIVETGMGLFSVGTSTISISPVIC